MLALIALNIGFETYNHFLYITGQLVFSLQEKNALWYEMPGVDPTVNEVEK